MRKNPKRIVLLAISGLYCCLSWMLMRQDYYIGGQQASSGRQFVHLLLTFAVLLAIILWKGRSIELMISRLSALPKIQGSAPFLVFFAVAFSMLYYPQNQAVWSSIGLGLAASTRLLVMQMFLAGWIISLVLLILLLLPETPAGLLQKAESMLFSLPEKPFLVAVLLLMFLSANMVSLFHFHHLPVLPEEVVHLFQAKIFSTGHMYASAPPLPDFFEFGDFLAAEKWFSPAPPGFALLLTPGMMVNSPWIISPIFASGCVVLLYFCAKRIYSEKIARCSIVLMLVSPFVLLLSSLHLSHVPATFFLLLSLFFFLRALDGARATDFLFCGLAAGAAVAITPVLGLAATAPFAVYSFWLLVKKRLAMPSFIALLFGAILPQAIFLSYGLVTSGHLPSPEYIFMSASGLYLGRFWAVLGEPSRSLATALLQSVVNLNNRVHYLSVFLLGWPLPALAFAAIPFAVASRNKWDYLLLGSFLTVSAATMFVPQDDFLMGPRTYYIIVPFLFILIARGLQAAPELWNILTQRNLSHQFLFLLVGVCMVYSFAFSFPPQLRFYSVSRIVFQQIPSPIHEKVASARIHNAVVFIDDFPLELAYGMGFWRNDPALSGDIIYARDRGDNSSLMRLYPQRRYYRFTAFGNILQEVFPNSQERRPVVFPEQEK